MAIRDLLWACPICGREGGLAAQRRDEEACTACGTRFRRGHGAAITATRPDGRTETLHAAEWSDRLPPLELAARAIADTDGPARLHREAVRVRFAEGYQPIRFRGEYLNRIERFGPYRDGVLTLETERILLELEGEVIEWPLESIRAVQPSSSTLQLRAGDSSLVSFRFPNGSARFWEELLSGALRALYHERGLGEIIEFQPRIVTR